jgi:hypothetical protein
VSYCSGRFAALHSIVTDMFVGFERQVCSCLHVNMEVASVEFLIFFQDTNLLNASYRGSECGWRVFRSWKGQENSPYRDVVSTLFT